MGTLWLGRVLIERGELEEAVGQLASAAAFEETRLAANVLMGEAFTGARQYGAARTALKSALRRDASDGRNGGGARQQIDEEYVQDLTRSRLRRRALRALAVAHAPGALWDRRPLLAAR